MIDGSVTFMTNMFEAFERSGHAPWVVIPRHPGVRESHPRIISLPSVPSPAAPRGYRWSVPSPRGVERRLKNASWDLVHLHSPFRTGWLGLQIARKRRLPVVLTYHTLYPVYAETYGPQWMGAFPRKAVVWWSRKVCNQCDAVIATSTPMVEELRSYGITVPIEVVPGGIHTKVFLHASRDPSLRATYGIPPGEKILLYAGRVTFEKSLDFLIRVLARVRQAQPAHLLLCGGGPALPSLLREARSLGVASAVHTSGLIADPQVLANHYAEADVFVFSSLTDTQGLVLLEAMAAGLPVVAVGALGVKETVQHEVTGLLTPPDVEAFAKAVIRVCETPEVAEGLRRRGRTHAAQFSFDRVAERHVALYRKIIKSKLQPAG